MIAFFKNCNYKNQYIPQSCEHVDLHERKWQKIWFLKKKKAVLPLKYSRKGNLRCHTFDFGELRAAAAECNARLPAGPRIPHLPHRHARNSTWRQLQSVFYFSDFFNCLIFILNRKQGTSRRTQLCSIYYFSTHSWVLIYHTKHRDRV